MSRYNLKKTPHDEGANREKAPVGFFTFQITDYKEKDKEGSSQHNRKRHKKA